MITDAQRARRKSGIFSSDVPRIMNGGGVRVALEKMGLLEGKYSDEDEATDEMAVGTKVETIILDAFEQIEDVQLDRSQDTRMHSEHDWLGCHPDALFSMLNVESKSVGWYRRHLWGDGGDEIPDDTMWQVQEQMEVLGVPLTKLPVLFINEENLRLLFLEKLPKINIFMVPRDRELGAYIIERSWKVWNCVQTDTLPEPETPSDVRLIYKKDNGLAIEATEEAVAAYDVWFDAETRFKLAETDLNRAKFEMQMAMKEASELRYRNRTLATWKLNNGRAGHTVAPSEPFREFRPKKLKNGEPITSLEKK